MSTRQVLIVALAGAAGLAGRADAAITHVGSTSAASTTTTLTIAKPSGTTANDVLVATVSGLGTQEIDAPSGWVALAATNTSDGRMRTQTYYRVAAAGEGASYGFVSASARSATGGIIALRGANHARPIDAVAAANGTSGNAVGPSVTTTGANDWVITAVAASRSTSFTAAAGTIERYELAGSGTTNHAATAAQAAAGPTPARTVAPRHGNSDWTAHTIAVRDAAAAGLSVALSGSPSFSADLNGGDTTATWSVPALLLDTRLSSSGWQLQATSTRFTSGTRMLPADALSVTDVGSASCYGGAPCSLPSNSVGLPVGVPAGVTAPNAVRFHNAAPGTGEGGMDLSISFAVTVPQNAYQGTYSSTVTVSVVSGP